MFEVDSKTLSAARNAVQNRSQGPQIRVLCLCTVGLLRSPTAAEILSQEPYGFNTRSAGVDRTYALIPLTFPLICWPTHFVCMTNFEKENLIYYQKHWRIKEYFPVQFAKQQIHVLGIEDEYDYRCGVLTQRIKDKLSVIFGPDGEA